MVAWFPEEGIVWTGDWCGSVLNLRCSLVAVSDHRRTEATGLGGEPQAGSPDPAGGQPAVPAPEEVCGHDGLKARIADLPELGSGDGPDGERSTPGGRPHLRSAGRGVCVPGGDFGCLLAPRDRLGTGPDSGSGTGTDRPAPGAGAATAGAGSVPHSDRGVQ